jgi:RND family efflux transporter MFP subunit
MRRQLTLSSELVPFQQIDVYAKESGYVQQLYVDYGSHVRAGQVIATLEIPELQAQLQEDDALVRSYAGQIKHAQGRLGKVQAQQNVLELEYKRLHNVSKSWPGLLAQQEVDDAQGKYLAAAAQVESSRESVAVAESQLAAAQAKRSRDQVLFDYSKITAPFSGVITKRYANLGTLVQAGTSSSTQVLPIVQLSENDLFRLVIPVPESYVRDIRIGDAVKVFIPSLNQTFPGRVARFSADVSEQTRTMHTEVDVPNPHGNLMPGLYADATLTLAHSGALLAVPVQAVHRDGDQASVDVVDTGGRIQTREVTPGVQTANYTAINSGLSRGDLVVVSDPSGLTSGEKVHPQITSPIQYQRPNEERQGS